MRTEKRCRLCLDELYEDDSPLEATRLSDRDLAIGDGLCEHHRNVEEIRTAKEAWYGKETRE